jgi:hypothetical protein
MYLYRRRILDRHDRAVRAVHFRRVDRPLSPQSGRARNASRSAIVVACCRSFGHVLNDQDLAPRWLRHQNGEWGPRGRASPKREKQSRSNREDCRSHARLIDKSRRALSGRRGWQGVPSALVEI